MTSQLLAVELSNLIQESKRKYPELRIAAEKSLGELKSLANTSELQVAADLKRRPAFVKPFTLACSSKSTKLANIGVLCLHRLVVGNGLSKDCLKEVLGALRDSSTLGNDVQLKVLQVLPSLLQNYAAQLKGHLLSTAVEVCSVLLASKTSVISSTAAASLQQVVVSVFGKVAAEDEAPSSEEASREILIGDGLVLVRHSAFDGYHLLNDLALLIEGLKPQFLHGVVLSVDVGLELIEAILADHGDTIPAHPELIHIFQAKLFPFVLRIISEGTQFSSNARAIRLTPYLLSNLLPVLPAECEMLLSVLNHTLDPDAAPMWKRILCMEVFRSIHGEAALVRDIYAHFDDSEDNPDVIGDHLALMVRVASEKPNIIGLGNQSSMPSSSISLADIAEEQAVLQAEGVTGTIGTAINLKASESQGLSSERSMMRVPCINQLDKSEPPNIPPTYIYALVLININLIAEGLARFLLPFSIPTDSKIRRKARHEKDGEDELKTEKYDSNIQRSENGSNTSRPSRPSRSRSFIAARLPTNPLSLESNALYKKIQTSSHMVDKCWPALLATYSTFLHAALDGEFYRSLVRSIQRFTQVAAILRLSTPRDAFLTTLSKNSVPQGVVALYSLRNGTHSSEEPSDPVRRQSSISTLEPPTPSRGNSFDVPRPSSEATNASLNTRNLLCLRALLNLGIALGPILGHAWSIVLETLQQADIVINNLASNKRPVQGTSVNNQYGQDETSTTQTGEIGGEVVAVRNAATRLIESTSNLLDNAFDDFLNSLGNLLREVPLLSKEGQAQNGTQQPRQSISRMNSESTAGSRGGSISKAMVTTRANEFVIQNLDELIRHNASRLIEDEPDHSGWDDIVNRLIGVVGTAHLAPSTRLKAAEAVTDLVTVSASQDVPQELRTVVRNRGLFALHRLVDSIYTNVAVKDKSSETCEADIHRRTLQCLQAVLAQYGDTLSDGWADVFYLLTSVFESKVNGHTLTFPNGDSQPNIQLRAPNLVRASFGPLELICSDFLDSVPTDHFDSLVLAISKFCIQQQDFNISLTATNFAWNVAKFLTTDSPFHLLPNPSVRSALLSSDSLGVKLEESGDVLQLLIRLSDSTRDYRLEIRHSALHNVFRILAMIGEKLDGSDWIVCQKFVLSRILDSNDETYTSLINKDPKDLGEKSLEWNSSAALAIDAIANLIEQFMESFTSDESFDQEWIRFVKHLEKLLDRQSLDLSLAVYYSLSKILKEAGRLETLRLQTKPLWALWLSRNPIADKPGIRRVDAQQASTAYLECLRDLYGLESEILPLKVAQQITRQLKECALLPATNAYSGDVDNLTSLQAQILSCIDMLQNNHTGVGSALIDSLSSFICLAYEVQHEPITKKFFTYVAMSKQAMEVAKRHVLKSKEMPEIYSTGALARVLQALAVPLRIRYQWTLNGTGKPPWQIACVTTVELLEATVPIAIELSHGSKGTVDPAFWADILGACGTLMSADLGSFDDMERIGADEEIDIAAIKQLRPILNLALGSTLASDQLRRRYVDLVFRNSIIHEPHIADLPESAEEDFLKCLQSQHIGRVEDLPPTPRLRMSYTLLERLFELVTVQDSSPERIRLAQAAAPYLILRVGIVLKAYVLDHPLRGRLPQPMSQKRELLYVLRRLVEMDSEPQAIPSTPHMVSDHKKHLHRIYPLVTRALKVARGDEEIQEALLKVIDAVGNDSMKA
ncbi:hypothetical protein MMC25_005164 [Agyrium rufum]|nr:hypothetical protein [Agyrium rufum]